ncbi:MAG: AgmX/PglI C-terminal domain-containing protein [Polyangiaceae bacterium]
MNKRSLALSAVVLSIVSGVAVAGCASGSDEPEVASGAQAQAAELHGQYGYVMIDEHVSASAGNVAARPAEVTGRLAPELIRDTVRAGFAEIHACDVGRAAGSSGKLTVKLVIGADGAVKGAVTSGAENVDGAMATCVKDAISEMHFPKSTGGDVEVEYPFLF